VTTTYTWDKTNPVVPLLLTETTAGETTRYIYGPGGVPIEQINPDGSVVYLHQDQLGSIRLLTSSTGTNVGERAYTPYGKTSVSTGTVVTPFGYAGQYTDPETGLQYLRARFYDPGTGNFISRDPLIGITGEAYGYTGGSPLNATDPSGLYWGEDFVKGAVEVVSETATAVANTVNGANVVGAAWGMVTSGGNCHMRDYRVECMGAWTIGGRPFTIGNFVMNPSSTNRLSEERFAHEKKHGYQYAILGPSFPVAYALDHAQAYVRKNLNGDDCKNENYMILEHTAGFEDGYDN
jgi:RHS repeat-associated protein